MEAFGQALAVKDLYGLRQDRPNSVRPVRTVTVPLFAVRDDRTVLFVRCSHYSLFFQYGIRSSVGPGLRKL